ncbi:MAG: hypothetical protein EPN91_05840 [Salinibacterium sp.]|nr:MAG: hypothetical protein EPN91_05840 [Salinibacterium sp.]
MDPDSNLRDQLRLAKQLLAEVDEGSQPDQDDIGRLAELVIALDNWIAGGGFLPKAWNYHPIRTDTIARIATCLAVAEDGLRTAPAGSDERGRMVHLRAQLKDLLEAARS